ncbi:ComF family protein [Anaerococcus sp. AGMB00486]|uniref:ComF family protein n=2 Tax=Anaerococcus TaxID=165779 RepID=A0ABX2NB78_9FIRM|nr:MULTISPECIES: phosphoribosyltransferase family protein [Anaerococcus]MDY3006991.1 phosphoribosyltransferase family protein [Anaerococcus porci]MSS78188.1 ComF family protein [Anaerococcus porci]NVF11946.1 ComF family protein [Anaerococcus faecalis]
MILDFLFLDENLCLSCKRETHEIHFLCEECLDKLDFVDNEFKILDYNTRVLYFYNDFMANLIADYKFNRNTSLYKVFGSMIYSYLKEKKLFNFDYILATPSSKSVLNKRGFDHIRLICDYFIKDLGISYLDSFKKIKNTKVQHILSREDREVNLKNSFFIDEDLTGKSILVFDDIITSSNTMKEIIRTLEKNNPDSIEIIALASSHRVKK